MVFYCEQALKAVRKAQVGSSILLDSTISSITYKSLDITQGSGTFRPGQYGASFPRQVTIIRPGELCADLSGYCSLREFRSQLRFPAGSPDDPDNGSAYPTMTRLLSRGAVPALAACLLFAATRPALAGGDILQPLPPELPDSALPAIILPAGVVPGSNTGTSAQGVTGIASQGDVLVGWPGSAYRLVRSTGVVTDLGRLPLPPEVGEVDAPVVPRGVSADGVRVRTAR